MRRSIKALILSLFINGCVTVKPLNSPETIAEDCLTTGATLDCSEKLLRGKIEIWTQKLQQCQKSGKYELGETPQEAAEDIKAAAKEIENRGKNCSDIPPMNAKASSKKADKNRPCPDLSSIDRIVEDCARKLEVTFKEQPVPAHIM